MQSAKKKKAAAVKRGPKEERFKINGNWQDANGQRRLAENVIEIEPPMKIVLFRAFQKEESSRVKDAKTKPASE